jgi:hypothetical protein
MISLLTLFIHYLTGFSFFKQKTQGEGPKQMTQGEGKFKCKLSLCVFFLFSRDDPFFLWFYLGTDCDSTLTTKGSL